MQNRIWCTLVHIKNCAHKIADLHVENKNILIKKKNTNNVIWDSKLY